MSKGSLGINPFSANTSNYSQQNGIWPCSSTWARRTLPNIETCVTGLIKQKLIRNVWRTTPTQAGQGRSS